jgi:uncharacterized protein (TIGR00255 family)
MQSMTGYGRGLAERGGLAVVVEIRSVNHRFLDLKLRGAPLDAALEDRLTARVKARVSRGALSVTVRFQGGTSRGGVHVDVEAARRAYGELSRLADALELDASIGLTLLSQVPGVLVQVEGERDDDLQGELLLEACDAALAALRTMREVEGKTLADDLRLRLDALAAIADQLTSLASTAPAEAERRLRERLARLLANAKVALDEGRLAQEVALLADRMDVSEELVRARSHIVQMGDVMRGGGEVGRRLDFLVQELGREWNTIASKAQAAEIARAVVEAKAELERIREQVQNLE